MWHFPVLKKKREFQTYKLNAKRYSKENRPITFTAVKQIEYAPLND